MIQLKNKNNEKIYEFISFIYYNKETYGLTYDDAEWAWYNMKDFIPVEEGIEW